ncbi:MAG: Y-family DNA polymerase [Salinarimonas sp.]
MSERIRREGLSQDEADADAHPSPLPSSPAHPSPLPRPLVTTCETRGALRLAATDPVALQRGLRSGMALTDARARHPDLIALPDDPAADRALMARLADWARRYTPLLAQDPPDALVLDMTGAAHLFGGEEALLADIRTHLARMGFQPRLAIAGTPEAAAALTRARRDRAGAPDPIIASGAEEAALRPLPLRALRVAPETCDALERLGLSRVEDILLRPRAPFAARFGADLIARIDAALGRVRSSIGARIEAPAYITERRFFEPILASDDVARTLERLAEELCAMLTRHGEGATRLEYMLFRVDGAVRRITLQAGRPVRDPDRIMLLFREKLAGLYDALNIGHGFDLARLTAVTVARLDQASPRLDGRARGQALAQLIDTLAARLGEERVRIPVAGDAHLPEEAARLRRPYARPSGRSSPSPWLAAPSSWFAAAAPDRPIRLFDQPEPIEALASVPDGPPLRFRWRRVLHETIAYEGPERIAPPWWRGGRLTRDYFRVEDREGRRFWLFRHGLYARETQTPRWYLHGLFG